MKSTNKVLSNTLILYSRLIISMLVGFFSTRIVFDALGEVDYGIYVLVAGVIGMLAFLNASMTGTSMRFISVSIGTKDNEKINTTFNSTLIIHVFIGLIVVVLMAITGLFLFDGVLNIPSDRILSAKVVYFLMCFSTFVVIVSVPFDALISANENFTALSIIEIIGTFLNLGVAFYIVSIKDNQLIIYAILVAIVHLTVRLIKQMYSRSKYKVIEINIRKYYDKNSIKEILSFTGWKALDSSAAVLYGQSISVLINVFFGVTLNAANGIAKQASGQLQNLTVSLLSAINPQIYKSEGSGDRKRMLKITAISAKFSFFIMALLSIPVVIELPFLLKLWLKNVPDFTVVFCTLLLIDMIIAKYTFPINTAIAASGKVKSITVVVLINRILQFLVSYTLFSQGFPPQSIYIVSIIFAILAIGYKLYFGKVLIDLDIREYVYNVIFVSTVPILITLALCMIPYFFLSEGFLRLITIVAVTFVFGLVLIFKIGLSHYEKQIILDVFNATKKRFKKVK